MLNYFYSFGYMKNGDMLNYFSPIGYMKNGDKIFQIFFKFYFKNSALLNFLNSHYIFLKYIIYFSNLFSNINIT